MPFHNPRLDRPPRSDCRSWNSPVTWLQPHSAVGWELSYASKYPSGDMLVNSPKTGPPTLLRLQILEEPFCLASTTTSYDLGVVLPLRDTEGDLPIHAPVRRPADIGLWILSDPVTQLYPHPTTFREFFPPRDLAGDMPVRSTDLGHCGAWSGPVTQLSPLSAAIQEQSCPPGTRWKTHSSRPWGQAHWPLSDCRYWSSLVPALLSYGPG